MESPTDSRSPSQTPPSQVLVIGVSGPSCSGKSTFAKALSGRLPEAAVLEQDLYFVDPELCPADANFCDLRWLRISDFLDAFHRLANGNAAELPVMDFQTFRQIGTITAEPARFLIVEGMTIYRVPQIAARCNRRYYLSCDWETLERRKRGRDAAERGKPPEIIEAQLSWMREEYIKDQDLIRAGEIQLVGLDELPDIAISLIGAANE